MIYGYLSSRENIQQLKEFGISEQNIDAAKPGDIIVFNNIDELGNDLPEIKSNFDSLVVRGIILQFLEQPLLNTIGKTEETLKTISFLFEYFIENKYSKKIIRPRGKKSAYKNLTEEQREILEDFYKEKISFREAMTLTGFSRATVYKLRKLLFPPDKKIFKRKLMIG